MENVYKHRDPVGEQFFQPSTNITFAASSIIYLKKHQEIISETIICYEREN